MITEEQKQKLWEWCGFQYIGGIAVPYYMTPNGDPVTRSSDFPALNMNNLVKWAVPCLYSWTLSKKSPGKVVLATVRSLGGRYGMAGSDDAAEALALAILRVVESK